jgi:hypothetical protein
MQERVEKLLPKSSREVWNWEMGKPLRKWNDEAWFVMDKNFVLNVYRPSQGETPPREILDLFHEFEKLPAPNGQSRVMKDVCLGFCYDPISALGFIYANDRCRQSDSGFVCQ